MQVYLHPILNFFTMTINACTLTSYMLLAILYVLFIFFSLLFLLLLFLFRYFLKITDKSAVKYFAQFKNCPWWHRVKFHFCSSALVSNSISCIWKVQIKNLSPPPPHPTVRKIKMCPQKLPEFMYFPLQIAFMKYVQWISFFSQRFKSLFWNLF